MLEALLPAHFNPKLCVLFQETPGSVALPEFLHFINTATHTHVLACPLYKSRTLVSRCLQVLDI